MGIHFHDEELPLCLQTSGSHLHRTWWNSFNVAACRRPSNQCRCVQVVQCEGDITATLLVCQAGMSWPLTQHMSLHRHLKAGPVWLSKSSNKHAALLQAS